MSPYTTLTMLAVSVLAMLGSSPVLIDGARDLTRSDHPGKDLSEIQLSREEFVHNPQVDVGDLAGAQSNGKVSMARREVEGGNDDDDDDDKYGAGDDDKYGAGDDDDDDDDEKEYAMGAQGRDRWGNDRNRCQRCRHYCRDRCSSRRCLRRCMHRNCYRCTRS